MTQLRAFGAFTGARYGSFAGRTPAARDVGELTQPRAFGAFSGKRYGSFAGRAEAGRNVGTLTHARAFGAFSGGRYGAFTGRTSATPTPTVDHAVIGSLREPRRFRFRPSLRDEDEELLLILSTALQLLD